MADSADALIVGAGPAGAACAVTLRELGFEGSILLTGREPDPPYDRPPASKAYLQGRTSRSDHLLYPEGFWAEHGIDLRVRSSVMKLDVAARVATLATKETVEFGRALVATGANVRRLRVDGATLDGIHYLRALGNADAIRADAAQASRVVLIGGSFIACEVAASLTTLGKQCTLVMIEDEPMCTAFGDIAGGYVARVLESHGVTLACGETLARFEGAERVERVVCESGLSLDAEMVVMGTGSVPDVMLARAAGLELGESGGIACDAGLRTSAEGVWAAGDVCEFDSVLFDRRTRIEHWEVARSQGAFVARAMLGESGAWDEVPYFWSDLADWLSLEYVGSARDWDREIVRGSVEEGAFTIFYCEGDRVTGALGVGGADLGAARAAITSRSPVDDAVAMNG